MSLYFDHNATTPLRPEARSAMLDALELTGNASAQHSAGRASRKIISSAREAVGMAMGVCAQDIVFTGCGTEAVNQAVFSAWTAGCRNMLFSAADHPASFNAAQIWGCPHEIIPVTCDGVTDIDWLAARIDRWDADKDGRLFVSAAAANSETGVIQPLEQIADMVQAAGGLLLVDAVQALGKIALPAIGADYIAVSAHKIGGPQGVGALYMAPDAPSQALLCGGGQERRKRSGTHNVAGIAGFGAAAKSCADSLAHTAILRDKIESGLSAMETGLTIFGDRAERLPNTSFFAVKDKAGTSLMMALDLADICVSTGTACSSGKVGESRAVTAMGRQDDAPKGALRVSLGYTSTADEVDKFLNVWAKIRNKTLPNRTAA